MNLEVLYIPNENGVEVEMKIFYRNQMQPKAWQGPVDGMNKLIPCITIPKQPCYFYINLNHT